MAALLTAEDKGQLISLVTVNIDKLIQVQGALGNLSPDHKGILIPLLIEKRDILSHVQEALQQDRLTTGDKDKLMDLISYKIDDIEAITTPLVLQELHSPEHRETITQLIREKVYYLSQVTEKLRH